MATPMEMSAVGTYATEDEADQARGRLTDAGFSPVEVREASEAAWQVEVARTRHAEALEELQRGEQHIIPDAW